MELFSDAYFMREALREANKALEQDEVPIGAVVVVNNRIIGRGHNLTETLNDVTAHAEMQAITASANYLGAKYLTDCSIYITLEPCVMCAGALKWAQIGRIVFGAYDQKYGLGNLKSQLIHPKTELIGGVMMEECASLLTEFFRKKRDRDFRSN